MLSISLYRSSYFQATSAIVIGVLLGYFCPEIRAAEPAAVLDPIEQHMPVTSTR